jgi:hypothetical protein
MHEHEHEPSPPARHAQAKGAADREVARHPIADLQRLAGNRAVAGLIGAAPVQRHAEIEPAPEEEAAEQSVQGAWTDVQRQEAPPLAFPTKTQIPWARLANADREDTVTSKLVSLWDLSRRDRLERGFPIKWEERTGNITAGDTVVGPPRSSAGEAAHITIPLTDGPKGTYTVATGHTHPPAPPGYVLKASAPATATAPTSAPTTPASPTTSPPRKPAPTTPAPSTASAPSPAGNRR